MELSRYLYVHDLGDIFAARVAMQPQDVILAFFHHSQLSNAQQCRSSSRLVRLIWLVEEEVRRQLLVLITGEVSLNNHITLEAEAAQLEKESVNVINLQEEIPAHPLNCFPFLFRHRDGMRTWW